MCLHIILEMGENLRLILGLFILLFLGVHTARAEGSNPPVIVIDPGHGGIDGGTQSADGAILEKDLNLLIATQLAARLKKDGIQVEMTRNTDEDVTKFAPKNRIWGRYRRDLFGRVEVARQTNATLFISIHGNHGKSTRRGGVVFYKKSSLHSYLLANELQIRLNALTQTFHMPHPGDFYILRNLDIPSVLVEYGYLSNPNELASLLEPRYQTKMVDSLAEGIEHFLIVQKWES
ncbi:N-acetylmuramoyl-L-alanine amidase family protein [Effusibacillus dendaii]|uniref:MurNAc-LAA domain-containing protein n=1 Tax=Effusibacillus dendaii TaxID=2743772 RepID=A0A7I8D9G5_9BACL|nr:N-acetylmuramoyl-L-alanine amidase [Effusibacillus dendaii]BCJ85629.1 hypothetical protein skT53_06140 [Effusibacillus dendaii]